MKFVEFEQVLGTGVKTILINPESVETLEEKMYSGTKITEIRLSSSLTLLTHESVTSLRNRLAD